MGALNESATLPKLLTEIERIFGHDVEVIVVDDGSTDGTRDRISEIIGTGFPLRPIYNGSPQTLARALSQGLAASRTEYVIFMDADLQHPPEMLPSILARLREGNDLVIASRYVQGGTAGERTPIRGLISRVACGITQISLASARSIRDPISGFFGVRVGSLIDIPQAPKGFEFLLPVLVSVNSLEPKVVEVPYHFMPRVEGESKIVTGVSFIARFLSQLIFVKRLEREQRRRVRANVSLVNSNSTV